MTSETPPASSAILLDGFTAERLLKESRSRPRSCTFAAPDGATPACLEVSLDIYRSSLPADVYRDAFSVAGRVLALAPLEKPARRQRKVWEYTGAGDTPPAEQSPEDWRPLESWDGGYHQLVSLGAGAPALEIGGIGMHITSGTDPWTSTRAMAAACVRPGDRVLDTCGGLGYTAIHAAEIGAREVLSAEPSAAVRELRARNPWSRLAAGLPVRLEPIDAFRLAARLEPGSIDAVVHDPPRPPLAPELYSDAFYLRLHELLAPAGRLYHYTGSPRALSHGEDFAAAVAARLRRVGFRVRALPELQGVLAEPRRRRTRGARGR